MSGSWSAAAVPILLFILNLSTLQTVLAIASVPWNYSDQEAWKSVPEWDCNGTRQSPINIDTNSLVTNNVTIDLRLTNFDKSFGGDFTNNGHSVRFDPASSAPKAVFINHRGTYEMQQFHFHWGNKSMLGSEHTINGQTYGGELHFVTRKTTGNSTAGDAFAVLGVLLVSDTSMSATGSWMELLNNIPTQNGNTSMVNGLRLTDFLPSDLSYYYYEGSLTTPACSEVVQWFLLRNTINVPSIFLDELRTNVTGESGTTLTMNFRMTQPLNGRQVVMHPRTIPTGGSVASGLASKQLAIVMFVAFLVCLLYF